jgi:hypothetical protein
MLGLSVFFVFVLPLLEHVMVVTLQAAPRI